ncbi:cytochrome C oxidase copper chaperone-domain-containing protein [Cantharellus anzutake]|uniref:cytochrome C oxidase copper chaperone-domain-containing protein n=1 Tax=Cantharellus anzutake TaxID=1750568 RepID=UPI0019035BDA|nr:cytochrome C oxidase copper chaperone-domain-containing protein [Cantharellus anzutake]KAF8344012.1 cytochrome C oxidase copper chaperone-domain-containing protein [Cantharellus anzutake]
MPGLLKSNTEVACTPQKPAPNPLNPEGIKPCCACPETKAARDECFMKHDSDTASKACMELVQKHIACMRGYGFNV